MLTITAKRSGHSNGMRAEAHAIGVVPMGDVPPIAPKAIAAHISGCLSLPAAVLPALKTPSHAFDSRRLQYDAAAIIRQLECEPAKGVEKMVAVLDADLFLPVFTHVFGEARQGGKAALVSLFRLFEAPQCRQLPSSLTLERAAKVALHELCHLYNLTHCQDSRCLMYFAGSLKDLDNTPLSFCRYCRGYFHDAVRRAARHPGATPAGNP